MKTYVLAFGLSLLAVAALVAHARPPVDLVPVFIPSPRVHVVHPPPASSGVFPGADVVPAGDLMRWFGGTRWDPVDQRWEAIPDSMWTFETGVGSSFDHSLPGVDPDKDPSFHATMEGWTGKDFTRVEPQYFRRLPDSAFVGSSSVCVGSAGGLGGTWSFHAGALEPEADSLCWATGQGYGNDWDVRIEHDDVYDGTGNVTWSFSYRNETEPGYDYSYAIVDTSGSGDEVVVFTRMGVAADSVSLVLVPGVSMRSDSGLVRFAFRVTSDGAYSDEDGLYGTSCGAFSVDDIEITGGGIAHAADFESGDDGWTAVPPEPGPGGERSRLEAVADLPPLPGSVGACPLGDSVLVFYDPATGGQAPLADNVAVSPWIDLVEGGVQGLSQKFLEVGGYFHLPLVDYVFLHTLVQWYPDTCGASGAVGLSPWRSDGFVRHFASPTCARSGDAFTRINFSPVIPAHAEAVRLAVGLINYCHLFQLCTDLSNTTPWIDNVRIGFRAYGETIQDAIDIAAAGDTVLVMPGVYRGVGNRNLNFQGKNLTLLAPAGPESTIVDCQGLGRGMRFSSGEDSTSLIMGLTIRNGVAPDDSGGGVRIEGASPSFFDCVIESCDATQAGGGVFIGADTSAAMPAFRDCVFRACTASRGGGLYGAGDDDAAQLTDCRIEGCTGSAGGGGSSGSIQALRCLYTGNVSTDAAALGGTFTDCTFQGNTGVGVQGFQGLGLSCGGAVLIRCLVTGNTKQGVGCAQCYDSIIIGNFEGGAAACSLWNCTIIGNSTTGSGGGIFDSFASRCLIAGNSAAQHGGGAYTSGGWAYRSEVEGCLVIGNAAQRGGGIYTSGMLEEFNHSTVAGNRAAQGGGLYVSSGPVSLSHSIVWGNCATILGDQIATADTMAVIDVTCSAVDTSGIEGPGEVQFLGPQVFEDPRFCAPSACQAAPSTEGRYGLAGDSPCLPANSPCDTLIGAAAESCATVGVPGWTRPRPGEAFLSAHPNPFHGSVIVVYVSPDVASPAIRIFDIAGRLVRELETATAAGAVTWDGKDAGGQDAPAGVYFIHLDGEIRRASRRVVLVK